jgi:Replication protein C C-terminal region
LGVSETLWGEACRIVGRQMAVVILAVVSTKPKEQFTRGTHGYFAAMIKRARTGELHVDRSLWSSGAIIGAVRPEDSGLGEGGYSITARRPTGEDKK